MIDAIRRAHNVYGKRRKDIAAELNVAPTTIYKWFNGHSTIPEHRRASLDRVFCEPVDWTQYERDFAANNNAPPRAKDLDEGEQDEIAPALDAAASPPLDAVIVDKPKRGIFDFLDDEWDEE